MPATETIRNKAQLKAMADYYLKQGKFRNSLLIVMGTHTALRISDLLRLQWEDVYDEMHGTFRLHVSITEKKTGKTKTIALNRQIIKALRLYFSYRRSAFLFANNRKGGHAIGRVQAWRIVREAAEAVGVQGKISCHSLRKTFGYQAWKSQAVVPCGADGDL